MCEIVSRDRLADEPYSNVICYPKLDMQELRKRLEELKELGVEALMFCGEKKVFNVSVLGKGCVGIVVAALSKHGKTALKIRRIDADRSGMLHEAEMLKLANQVNVGPKLLAASENFLLMQYIEGKLLPEWIKTLKGKETKMRIRSVLKNMLEQCWQLDKIGLDHGELSHAPKHILIDAHNKPYIVDFETASTKRKTANVTSLCQFLFLRSQTAKLIKRKFYEPQSDRLIQTLKSYKQTPTKEKFYNILAVCGLEMKE
ncbi:MAG: serine/threonine protein kinase [Candidatus Bathyarchaeia archaeon]